MASGQVSPGVVISEFDFSDYVERQGSAVVGIVGTANKGPINTLTVINNERQLIDTFGKPNAPVFNATTGLYGTVGLVTPALQYLRQGNQLLVVRCNGAATTATTNLLDSGTDPALVISALTPGSWPNASKENVEFRVVAATGAMAGVVYFQLQIRVGGVLREKYDNLTITGIGQDPTNNPITRINGISQLITVDIEDTNPTTTSWLATGSGSGNTGSDGSVTASSFYDANSPQTGVLLFEDADTVNCDLLMIPGVNTEVTDSGNSVIKGAVAMAEARGDMLVLIDPPITENTPQKAIDFINSNGSINSSYGAYYWPWLQIYDAHNKITCWTPPSGLVAGQCAYNDRQADPWFAPAGLQRGRIITASAVQYTTKLAERDRLYASGQCVNPIVNFTGDGIIIWGQKTCQRTATALNRINVRRMMNYLKKVAGRAVKQLIMEPNDAKTWRRFVQILTPPIAQVKERRGLYDYSIKCDSTTNPPDQIDRNEMKGQILVKPTKTAEIIGIDFTILNTGASFSEFTTG